MRRGWLLLLVAVLLLALVVLATFQYRWIGELSAAEEQRARAALNDSARRFGEDLERVIGGTTSAFGGAARDPKELAGRYGDWKSNSHNPRLIAAMYVVDRPREQGGAPALFKLDPEKRTLAPAQWSGALAEARPAIERWVPATRPPFLASALIAMSPLRPMAEPEPEPPPEDAQPQPRPGPGPGPRTRPGPPQEGRPWPPPPPRDGEGWRPPPPPGEGFGPPPGEGYGPPPEGYPPPREQQRQEPPRPRPRRPRPNGGPGLLLVQLDRAAVLELMGEVARRDFPHDRYDVAITNGGTVVLRTNAAWPGSANAGADLVQPALVERGPRDQPQPSPWRVLVHRRGDATPYALEQTRRRNLAISGGGLLILAIAMALLVLLIRRADRLRMQQLEFVAGITHEINTPIAAISSAGQNLADGIVQEGQVPRYGSLIVKESRRLSEMVGQVLDFAGMQARGGLRNVEPVDVGEVVAEAIVQQRWLAEELGVAVEAEIEPGLPQVDGDPESLTRAIGNLLANAIRHGGEGKWAGVRAVRDGSFVVITVEDHGHGVAPRDIPHLFEPFYRGKEASKTRGTGLGLTIVQQIAAAHGGSVSVARKRERGAAFILRIPEGAHA